MKSLPHIFILTACHDRRAITESFARQVAEQDHAACTLVLVDDGSSDGSSGAVRHILKERLVVLTGEGSWWWGGSMQRGLCAITQLRPRPNDIVVFCNDDVMFAPDFLSRGARILAELPGVMLLAQGVDATTGVVVERGQHFKPWRLAVRQALTPAELNCAPTRGLFARWADVRHVGGFIPQRLPHYYSDYEWTSRATRLGLRIICVPELALRVRIEATGLHGLCDHGCRYRRLLWSVRHAGNPIYQIRFAARVCPWPLAAIHLVRIWMQTMLRLAIRS